MSTVACVLYAKCWDCQFGYHPGRPHSWMDAEDIEFSKTVTWPETDEEWAALVESHPCNCWCLKTPPCKACMGSGTRRRPMREDRPCRSCGGHGVARPGRSSRVSQTRVAYARRKNRPSR